MHSTISPNLLITHKSNMPLKREDFYQLESVLSMLPNVILYVKDHTRRWVACNSYALTFLNRSNHEEILGLREEDFFPKAIAKAIREDDLLVLDKGERVIERLELVANRHGQLVWANTSKLPIVNESGEICGLVGVTQLLKLDAELPPKYERFRKVVGAIENKLATQLRVVDLAAIVNMSESHFRRSFKQCFGIAPQQFILQQRLRLAASLLSSTSRTVSEVASECGFGDQSHFSRQFGRFFGESPRSYRMRES